MIGERLNEWIERYKGNGYLHGTLLVTINDNIIINEGFGMANWEHMVPNNSTTKFRIGSLTKAFTALAIYQLHENGLLNVDDAIGKYIPNYPQGEKITIYHCLTNTSGIPNYTSTPDFWSTTMRLPKTLEELINTFKDEKLCFEPGSEFEYSNSGYALLTTIIEKVSGISYGAYIKEKICFPLGMYHTGCDDGVEVISNLASGYSYWEKPIHAAFADLSFPLGAYGLYSTTEDLFLWDKALKSSLLLNKGLTKRMFTSYKEHYACGWMISDILGRKCVHHFGDISGYFSDFLRFPDEQVTIIFLSNMNVTPVTHITREIAKIIFEESVALPAPAIPIEIRDKEGFIGKYVMEDDRGVIEVSMKQEELYLTVPKMYGVLYKFKLIPIKHTFTYTSFLTEMVHEQLIFYHSSSQFGVRVRYIDYHDNEFKVYRRVGNIVN